MLACTPNAAVDPGGSDFRFHNDGALDIVVTNGPAR